MANSYNGWPASRNPDDFGGLAKLTVAGESFVPGVRAGDVHTVLEYVALQLHARVEPIVRSEWHQADDWGFSYRLNRNANNLSCHASGTAIDYNATRHPNGRRGTFTREQVEVIREILAEVDNVVRWGGDFHGTPDEMHFEICKNAQLVSVTANRIRSGPGVIVAVKPASLAVKTPTGRPTIRLESKGSAVKVVQRFLGLPDDGYFGPKTLARVKKYQKDHGLVADGVVGPKTWAALG